MLTRGGVQRYHNIPAATQVALPGYVKEQTTNNILQTWAITRPVSSPGGVSYPAFVTGPGMQAKPGALTRGGIMPLSPAIPKMAMDPSNPETWQRQYTFS